MKDFRSRKKQHRFFSSPVYFIILGFILVVSIRATASAFHKKDVAQQQEDKISTRYQEALDKKQKYLDDLARLESKRGLEAELRTRFDVVREGETMIKIVE